MPPVMMSLQGGSQHSAAQHVAPPCLCPGAAQSEERSKDGAVIVEFIDATDTPLRPISPSFPQSFFHQCQFLYIP